MTQSTNENTLILDIGKTHVKLHVLDDSYLSIYSKEMDNLVVHTGQYPAASVSAIWHWFKTNVKEFAGNFNITRITITTHGATAALIDRNSETDDGLVLPVLDYEFTGTDEQSPNYAQVRPDFSQTYSPNLPAGLNLGRQLYWLKNQFPQEFAKATDILMYPQYWVWRLTGQRYSEITSLGCHTDLWSVAGNDYSSLVDELECRDKFPPLAPAWQNCGGLRAELSEELGIDSQCQVFSGLHDSNASFLRYKLTQGDKPFTVVSSGTWTILMASQVPLTNLQQSKDMLANIDALSSPIACARFMGGREFAAICEQTQAKVSDHFDEQDLQAVIDKAVLALPDFSGGSGPFGGCEPAFKGPVDQVKGAALATLYCALLVDYQLSVLQSKGTVYIEGAFLKNPLLCALINQLRTEQNVELSQDSTGTVMGAAYLTDWDNVQSQIETSQAKTTQLQGLAAYQALWLAQINQQN
ncbi:hypothetical protein C2869_06315 [Saccharobesus litoralis]|uniref:Uncharacterized protein n=1 Tax=Saccharobesus litoralis TaxID=2172099 RepID=A0A2S0VPD2_9ALTE|nr:FGGY family carbohydrate kinase [Saccharobesus litoralis]AWB66077.1 hypothetical protein C2869_06315 [Saccharobesus litoralis]